MLQKVHIKTYLPLRNRVILFYTFLKNNIAYVAIWAFVWLLNFNIISIVVEFMAFYLYFAVSFDFISIYTQFCKLAIDLQPMFNTIPTVGWILMAVVFIYIWRKGYAMDKLLHNESKNKGFINERPIVLMLCGTMGSNKTKTATDMALSQEVMFRQEAYKKIIENDLRFPYFTWITFENDIKKNMEEGKIFNLATCRAFIAEKKTVFETEENINNMWGYDYERYGLTHDNKLEIMSIWTVLENYVQLYFIYILESSLLITNYAIRTDNVIASVGNFPMWNTSFFKDSKKIDACSRHSHIIDYDTLRLGRRIVAEREDTFEFGVVVITEIGKERGNNLENIEVKKTEDTANQKNDMFNKTLKMIRHSATVDFFPFVKVIVDEQRPESWGADARDLCDIAYIQSVDKEKLALPLFFVEELVCDLFHNQFKVFYQEYRFNRADHIVLSRIMKVVGEKLYNYHKKTYNMYGYRRLVVGVEAGRQLGETKQNYYYLSNKKIHAKRYSTDCFADFFMQKSINNKIGLQKMKEYFSEKATLSELKEQNSYFMNDLLNKPTRPVKRVSDGRVAKKGTAVR